VIKDFEYFKNIVKIKDFHDDDLDEIIGKH